jgi:hypothetical protein
MDENPHPTKRYVNVLLFQMHLSRKLEMTLRKSVALPSFADKPDLAVPTFEHARNRLKIMANMDHLKHVMKPTASHLRLLCSEETGPASLLRHEYEVHLIFDDAPPDPSVHIRLKQEREYTEDGVLWR